MLKRIALWTLSCLLIACCLSSARGEEDDEVYYQEPAKQPELSIALPAPASTYEAGGKLTLRASGTALTHMDAVLAWEGGELTCEASGNELEYVFDVGQLYQSATLLITGYALGADGKETSVQASVEILAPREKLMNDIFALALKNSKDSYYKHAPAQTDTDRGVCKNFVMRLFDTYKDAYRMAEYPDLSLHMPKNKSKKDSAPYQYGIEWRAESAEDGSPFYIAAQYKYDDSLTKAENQQKCREVLHSVQKGDFFQMCGDYYYGNGPHSLLFMAAYDPQTDQLHWTDSNMKGDSVNGARWGYLQYDAVNTAEWFVDAISGKSTYKTRGCTIYRLREDLFVR